MKILILNKSIRIVPNYEKNVLEVFVPDNKKKFEIEGDFQKFIKIISKFLKPHKVKENDQEAQDLLEFGVLVEFDKHKDEEYVNVWEENNWEDFLFFLKSTENYKYNDISPDSKEQIRLKERIYKSYLDEKGFENVGSFSKKDTSNVETVNLNLFSKLEKEPHDFFKTIFNRKTTRDFNFIPVKAEYLSWVLKNSFYEARGRKIKAMNDITSSLANYTNSHLLWIKPLIGINNVEGVKSGLYEYDYMDHKLIWIGKEVTYDKLQRIAIGQKFVRGTGFTIFMKVDFQNIMWKYRYPSAYKQILISVAEMAQKVVTCAVSLDLGVFQSPAIKDQLSRDYLLSEVCKEEVLYYVSIGNFNSTKNYANLSQIYDKLMGDRTGMVKIVKDLINPNFSSKKTLRVLDLACGTGKLHEYFEGRYKVTGIDLSGDMLKIAKGNHPKNEYVKGDAKRFLRENTFDVVTFNYDSINHLLTLEEWVATFEASHKNLKKNGVFIFDMNTIQKLESISKENLFKTKVEQTPVSLKVTKLNNGIYNWNIDYETKDKQLLSENILETSFELEIVKKELKKLFKKVEVRIFEKGNRAYFSCKK